MDLSACDMTKLLATISLPLLLYGLSGRWCPWYISRNVSISFCPLANLYRVPISLLHQSTSSSIHLLFDLPLLFLPSNMPNTTCLISLSSGIRHMRPEKFSFLSIILCMMLTPMPILFITSLFLILCCHLMFNILHRHFIAKTQDGSCHFSWTYMSWLHTSRHSSHIPTVTLSWSGYWYLYFAILSWNFERPRLLCQFCT